MLVVREANGRVSPTAAPNLKTLPAPPIWVRERGVASLFTVPPRASTPSPPTLVFPVSVMAPAYEAAPLEATCNVPPRFSASAPIATPSPTSSVAPLATVVPPAVLPSAVLLAATSVPALTTVAPV